MLLEEYLRKRKIQEEEYKLPYHWVAKGIDRISYESHSQYVVDLIKEQVKKPLTIVDCGCGDGFFTSFLVKSFSSVCIIGVDLVFTPPLGAVGG